MNFTLGFLKTVVLPAFPRDLARTDVKVQIHSSCLQREDLPAEMFRPRPANLSSIPPPTRSSSTSSREEIDLAPSESPPSNPSGDPPAPPEASHKRKRQGSPSPKQDKGESTDGQEDTSGDEFESASSGSDSSEEVDQWLGRTAPETANASRPSAVPPKARILQAAPPPKRARFATPSPPLVNSIPKPRGSVGSVGGYQIFEKLQPRWDRAEYEKLKSDAKKLIKEHLDTTLSVSKQDKGKVDNICNLMEKKYPALAIYANCWPVRDLILQTLKNKSEYSRKKQRQDSPAPASRTRRLSSSEEEEC